jgi:hypothetical protein
VTATRAGSGCAARAAGRPSFRAGGAAGVSANGRGADGRCAGRPAACGARACAGWRARRGGRSGAACRGARACGGAAWGSPPAVRRCGPGTRALAARRRFFVAYDVDRAPDHLGANLGGGLLKLSPRGRGGAPQRVRREGASCEGGRKGWNSCCDLAGHDGIPAGVLQTQSAPCTATGAQAHGKALAKLSVVAFAPGAAFDVGAVVATSAFPER